MFTPSSGYFVAQSSWDMKINHHSRINRSGVTVAYRCLLHVICFLNLSFPSPGIIYLTSTLSHLESTTLTLVVRAQDGGGLTSVINANITIHILQTTLAPSEFERPKYTFSVYEDAPEDSPVGTVKAKESLSKYFLCCIGICYWNIPCISLGCALLKKPFLLSM